MFTGACLMFQIICQLTVVPAGRVKRQPAQLSCQQTVISFLCLIVAGTATELYHATYPALTQPLRAWNTLCQHPPYFRLYISFLTILFGTKCSKLKLDHISFRRFSISNCLRLLRALLSIPLDLAFHLKNGFANSVPTYNYLKSQARPCFL